jgi:hypothetical protein
MERDTDLKTREEGAERAALREFYGRAPYAWDRLPQAPPGVLSYAKPVQIIPGNAPKTPGQVIAIWDSRPVNARDFESVFQYNTTNGPPSTITVQSAAFRVPLNYVAFVRSVTYYWVIAGGAMFDDPAMVSPANLFLGLFVDGVAQGFMETDEPDPPPSNDWMVTEAPVVVLPPVAQVVLPSIGIDVPVFVVAPPGSLIEWRGRISFGLAQNVAPGQMSFKGTLRLERGINLPSEVTT